MHSEAWAFLKQATLAYRDKKCRVLELGSKDLNGSPRGLFPKARYTGIDLEAGPGVDIVADATTWEPDGEYDVVVCAEVFEHCAEWRQLVEVAEWALTPGGLCVVSAACDPREPHSATDGGPLRAGEFYENVKPEVLCAVFTDWFEFVQVGVHPRGDVYATGIKCASS